MSYKLFNERIASAIEHHKDRTGWASIENKQFMKELFSGSYNEKNCEQLKLFIKRHNQSFIWKEDGTRFLVSINHHTRLRQRQPKYQNFDFKIYWKKILLFIKCFSSLFVKFIGLFKSLFATNPKYKEKKENQRDVACKEENIKPSKKERVVIIQNQKKRKETDNIPISGESHKEDNSFEKIKQQKENEKEPQIKEASEALPDSFSEFSVISNRTLYREACKNIIPTLLESNLFYINDEDKEDTLFKIRIDLYLSNVYILRKETNSIYQKEEVATFHTGLFTKEGNAIFVLCKKNGNYNKPNTQGKIPPRPPYIFDSFVINDKSEKALLLNHLFPDLSNISLIWDKDINPRNLFFDLTLSISDKNKFRLLKNNLFKFPEEWIKSIPNIEEYEQRLLNKTGKKRYNIKKNIGMEIFKNPEVYKIFKNAFEDALSQSINRIYQNPFYAIPGFNILQKKIVLFLPLQFNLKDRVHHLVLSLSYSEGIYRYCSLTSISAGLLSIRTLAPLSENWIDQNLLQQEITPKEQL